MKILQINITRNTGSTGKILDRINTLINNNGFEGYSLVSNCISPIPVNTYVVHPGTPAIVNRWILFISRISGLNGYRYKHKTENAIEWINSIKPDVIHLHNIHGDWLNLELLFNYIHNKSIPIVWTLHDCWSFTGRCSYFGKYNCNKWKTECNDCPDLVTYPKSYFWDFSNKMFKDKKLLFKSIKKCHLTVPSNWLKSIVNESFMNEYPITVINNGIDTDKFKPNNHHYFNNVKDKFVILGVAMSWSERKGLDNFIKLDKIIDHNKYQIILVGLNNRQLKTLPKTIIGIKCTKTQEELCQIYSQADCLLNCSSQETFGMTTIEAMSCGTPVIALNKTAVPEPITEKTGIIVNNNTPEELYNCIKTIQNGNFPPEECRNHILENYSYQKVFSRYIDIYKSILKS